MKLQDSIVIYERPSVSDGAGGQTPGALTVITRTWGQVKPLSGFMALTFQQMTGSQGFEIILRTDFDFPPDRKYMIGYEGIYGEQIMFVHSVQIDKHYTKLTCKSENKLPVQTT
jgi:hypothetical protein